MYDEINVSDQDPSFLVSEKRKVLLVSLLCYDAVASLQMNIAVDFNHAFEFEHRF